MKRTNKHNKTKLFLAVIVAVLVIGVGLFVFAKSRDNKDTPAQTSSKLPTAQSDYNARSKPEPSSINPQEGTATDNGGKVVNIAPENQWTTSDSGLLTLFQPAKSSKLSSGTTISGKAEAQQVSYRIVDNSVGVIARGSLKVVEGKFSGSLQFSAQGKTGTLEVFTVDPTTDRETNGVTINVQF